MTLIDKVFTSVGDVCDIDDAVIMLKGLLKGTRYSTQKAYGSIGGACNSGFLMRIGKTLMRVR